MNKTAADITSIILMFVPATVGEFAVNDWHGFDITTSSKTVRVVPDDENAATVHTFNRNMVLTSTAQFLNVPAELIAQYVIAAAA